MRSLRFLLSRRWLLFAAAVVLLAAATVWLGRWQFDRLEDRKESNTVVRANEDRSPAPVDEVLAPGQPVAEAEEWRLVTARGEYDPTQTVVVRYRTRDGAPGVDVVVPLVTSGGTSLLVDRGWLQTEPTGADRGQVPDPPAGEIEVVGWARADGSGDSTVVTDLSTRAISSATIGAAIDREVYGGFVELKSENGEPAAGLEPVELPELNNGPHFFYGLQWWFFGVLAVFGFCYLAYDEWQHGPRTARRRSKAAPAQRERNMPPSTGSITPVTNDAAGESRKAAARPNSSGSP